MRVFLNFRTKSFQLRRCKPNRESSNKNKEEEKWNSKGQDKLSLKRKNPKYQEIEGHGGIRILEVMLEISRVRNPI